MLQVITLPKECNQCFKLLSLCYCFCSDDESANSDSNVDNEEDEWERLQSGITRKEKVLEGKSKDSHEVHCPHFPDVSYKLEQFLE